MKIDSFCHIVPKRYKAALEKATGRSLYKGVTLLHDYEARIKEMESHGDLAQILTAGSIDELENLTPIDALMISQIVNEEMAELVSSYPEHFWGGIATIPLSDIDAAVKEIDRVVDQLGLKGLQITTTFRGESIASEKFFPIYELMADLDLPVLFHPCNGPRAKPDMIFNWPMETTWMMIDMSTSGVFEKYPDIKFMTHHCGAMIPTFANRVYISWFKNRFYPQTSDAKSPEDYFENIRKFYNDTALYGNSTAALEVGVDFFGVDHILFGTDFPLDGNRDPKGVGQTANTIDSINRMKLSESEKQMIFEENARKLFKLKD
ncbi:MAG: amidohydrolase family protein [Saccharofermentanales bacterium]|jgi:predicted TIM-barrel fold metal-dependent hydrolase